MSVTKNFRLLIREIFLLTPLILPLALIIPFVLFGNIGYSIDNHTRIKYTYKIVEYEIINWTEQVDWISSFDGHSLRVASGEYIRIIKLIVCVTLLSGGLIGFGLIQRHYNLPMNIPPKEPRWQARRVAFVSITFIFLINALYTVILFMADVFPDVNKEFVGITALVSGHPLYLVIMAVCCITIFPLYEECLCRGGVQRSLLHIGFSPWLCVGLQSVLFGILHTCNGDNTPGAKLVGATMAGLFLGTVYLKTGRLWVPILIHIFWNSCSIIFLSIVKLKYR